MQRSEPKSKSSFNDIRHRASHAILDTIVMNITKMGMESHVQRISEAHTSYNDIVATPLYQTNASEALKAALVGTRET